MLMNNAQNVRSYSPVSAETSRADSMNVKEKLKELVKKQIAHEVITALTLADMAHSYWKMGLEGYCYKLQHMASKEFKENFDWRKYYCEVFEEAPKIELQYESQELPKSIDEIYNKMYDLHLKNKENLHEMLKIANENHMYSEISTLMKAYSKCEEHQEKLEAKMKKSQIFGYDVAYILSKDEELKCEYRKHNEHEKHSK